MIFVTIACRADLFKAGTFYNRCNSHCRPLPLVEEEMGMEHAGIGVGGEAL
jgi:hypothetical protein